MTRDSRLQDRLRGMLLAGAVGDALGAPLEFLSRADIERRWGPLGPETYVAGSWPAGTFTDDTQMTLFTAEGIIRAVVRGRLRGLSNPVGVVHHAYLRWLHTQGVPVARFEASESAPDGWLVGQAFLHAQRAPGRTCLGALQAAREFGEVASNDSKGCGAVMRMAPAAVWDLSSHRGLHGGRSVSFEEGVAYGKLTHGHPTGSLAAGAFARMLNLVLQGQQDLRRAAEEALRDLRAHPRHEETLAAVEGALHAAEEGDASVDRLARLGEGWIAEEALAIGLYAALVAPDVRTGLRLAVAHSGDSDSTGSIAGNLLGALHGEAAIPDDLLEGLEGRDVIRQVADDLQRLVLEEWGEDDFSKQDWERYPGW